MRRTGFSVAILTVISTVLVPANADPSTDMMNVWQPYIGCMKFCSDNFQECEKICANAWPQPDGFGYYCAPFLMERGKCPPKRDMLRP